MPATHCHTRNTNCHTRECGYPSPASLMPYTVTPTHIPDLLILEPKVFGDARATPNDYNAIIAIIAIIAIKLRGAK